MKQMLEELVSLIEGFLKAVNELLNEVEKLA